MPSTADKENFKVFRSSNKKCLSLAVVLVTFSEQAFSAFPALSCASLSPSDFLDQSI